MLTLHALVVVSPTNIVRISTAGITIHLFTRLSAKNSRMHFETSGNLPRFPLRAVLCNVFIRQTSKTETSWGYKLNTLLVSASSQGFTISCTCFKLRSGHELLIGATERQHLCSYPPRLHEQFLCDNFYITNI